MASIFTKIINGDIPCYKVAEDNLHFAFLDINPLVKGHVLVIPKIETDYIFDLSDNDLSSLVLFAKKVSKAIKASIACERVGVVVLGLEVRHAHIHLVPLQSEADVDFRRAKLKLSDEEFIEIANTISAKLQ